jgi:inorganic pyrophosphatase
MNLERVTAGRDVPDDVNVIIEIPMLADPVKYEVDKESGAMFVDRFMSTAMHYPCNYGYVPRTLSGDGDPVDVLVLSPRDVPESQLAAIRHFFEHYKDLERGKWVKVQGWLGAAAAKKEILDGVKRFRRAAGSTAP